MKSTSRYLWLLLVVAVLALADTFGPGWLTELDRLGDDALIRLHAQSRSAPDDIVMIDIDQHSLEQMQATAGSWPWPRSVHAELIDGLARQQPAAIALDILFNERDSFRADSDALLNATLAAQRNVYLPTVLLGDGRPARLAALPPSLGLLRGPSASNDAAAPLLLPLAIRPESWRGGLINLSTDEDKVARRYLVAQPVDGWQIPSLPGRIARDLGWSVPQQQFITLNWYRPGSFHQVSYSDLFADLALEKPRRPPKELRGKVLIVTATAPGLHDLRVTPISTLHSGGEILATAIANLHQRDELRTLPPQAALVLAALLLWWLARQAAPGERRLARLGLQLAGLSAVAVGAAWLSLRLKLQWPVFSPLAVAWTYYWLCAGGAYLEERQRRLHITQLMSRFVDTRVVAEVIASGGLGDLRSGQTREITVLFCDIRSFTTMSEQHSAEDIVALLNRYFARHVEVIFRHGGTLDKFIGDAVMAFWGAPADDPEHAIHAAEAALDMAAGLEEMRRDFADLVDSIDFGIGLHTGQAVVGLIGSPERLDYTAIGDAVNLASRIEGETKHHGRILVSESTRAACDDRFEFLERGAHQVKGREQAVNLYELRRRT